MLKFKKRKVAVGRPKKKVVKDPMVDDVEETEIEFICPVRGKVKQKVKIKKLKPPTRDSFHVVSVNDAVENIGDDGLSIYEGNPGEETE